VWGGPAAAGPCAARIRTPARDGKPRADIVREQLSAAHRYYNVLIEIERERRRLYREARASLGDLAPVIGA